MKAAGISLIENHTQRAKVLTLFTFGVLFFMWGLITVLNSVLSKHLVYIFGVDYSLSTLMDLTFFGSYLIVSVPAGKLIDRIGFKNTILIGWVAVTAGCFVFTAAVLSRSYYLFLFALFILAGGITILQVAANLYIVLNGKSSNSASRLTFVQALNSLGTVVAPMLAGILLSKMVDVPSNILAKLDSKELVEMTAGFVYLPYLFLGILMTIFAFVLKNAKISDLSTKGVEPLNKITSLRKRHVLHFPQLRLGAFAIFAYVGSEVALASYLGIFGSDFNRNLYWILAMVGRFAGALIMTKVSPHKAVGFCAGMAAFLVLVSIVTFGGLSIWAITLVGLFNSILFPAIFALGVNGLGKFSEEGSSVLIMFIVGGAVIPFMVKNFSYVNYHVAFIIPIICYFYITLYGLKLSKYEKESTVIEKEGGKDKRGVLSSTQAV